MTFQFKIFCDDLYSQRKTIFIMSLVSLFKSQNTPQKVFLLKMIFSWDLLEKYEIRFLKAH